MNDEEAKNAGLSLEVHTLSNHLQSLREQVQIILNQLPQMRDDYSKLFASVNSHKEEVKASIAEGDKLRALVAIIREEFARNLTSCHDALIKLIEDKFKHVVGLQEAHKDIQEAIEKIALKMEEVALDSKNAMLKSTNNDIIVQLNKKKLENIQLVLKNHELNK